MKITFIGTSHGVPEAHRKCSCTMIEAGGNTYFVDMGTSGIDALRVRNIPVESVKGIFITHMHGDHCDGLIQFVDLMNWFFRDADPEIFLPIIESKDAIEKWIDATTIQVRREVRYSETVAGEIFDDGVIKVTAFRTSHGAKSFAYLVEAEGKRVLFTGDLCNPGFDFPTPVLEKPLDLVICESAHFNATDYLPVFENHDIRKVCVNHYSDWFLRNVMDFCDELNKKGIPAMRVMDDNEVTL